MKYHFFFLGAIFMLLSSVVHAHPTGNMIAVGEHVLWSYINPIDDLEHHACVMIWNKTSDPKVFMHSRHPASDFMLSHDQDDIYIIERRHVTSSQRFEVRILKTTVKGNSKVIWDWFTDEWRIGEGGFLMNSDDEIIFCRYPDLLRMKRGKKPVKHLNIKQPIKRMRAVEHNQILLMGDQDCFLIGQNGTLKNQWDDVIDATVVNAPLDRNQFFDADYKNGALLLAYWGNRSFELIDTHGEQKTIVKQTDPLTPHWVAFWEDAVLLFSSKLVWDGSTPKPYLILYNNQNHYDVIWVEP